MHIGTNILLHKAIPYLSTLDSDGLYFVIDNSTQEAIPPDFKFFALKHHILELNISPLDKNLCLLETIWEWLHRGNASRASVLIVIGGGTLCDLAGFAAASYMRGISVVYIPTTLLAMVDASLGGKTAIDFAGIKNLIGVFHQPLEIFVDTAFLSTLPLNEFYSGYGEIIKTGLLIGESLWYKLLSWGDPQGLSQEELSELITICATYKQSVVDKDPTERSGERRVLNLGHTVAHALEAYSRQNDGQKALLHGEAVVIGLIVEAYLAHEYLGLNKKLILQLMTYISEYYPQYYYTCQSYPELIRLMHKDKKNQSGEISFILLQDLGKTSPLTGVDEEKIKEALDFYREAFGR